MHLSERLNTIVSLIPNAWSVVDVGTDHAAVPIELARKNRNRRIIGVEYNIRPYYQAAQKIVNAGLETTVEIRKGYGLECVEAGETDVAVIAGLGSATIEQIVRKGSKVAQGLKSLILGPMDFPYKLRQYLLLNNYSILQEILVHEFRWYEILVVAPGVVRDALCGPAATDSELFSNVQALFNGRLDYWQDMPLQMMLEFLPVFNGNWSKGVGFLQEKRAGCSRILQNLPMISNTSNRRKELEARLQILRELEEKICALTS